MDSKAKMKLTQNKVSNFQVGTVDRRNPAPVDR